MNDIEKLEERIAQLTVLVKTGTETLKSLKETLKTVEEERDRLVDLREPKFERVKKDESYYFIGSGVCGDFYINSDTEEGHPLDEALYNKNNYFHTKQRAQEVVDKISFLLKLERLHDIYCPDFNLGLGDGLDVEKYYVYYNFVHEKWMDSCAIHASHAAQVYFPTKDIAQKVCDILNKELEEV